MRAVVQIKDEPLYRRNAFYSGLSAHGYEVVPRIFNIQPSDCLVIWNRYGIGHIEAKRFEAVGAKVLVAENGYLGREWLGTSWYALSKNHHNGAGSWNDLGPERWDGWNVELESWREGGSEIVGLPQRGIGEPGVAMPFGWCNGRADRCRVHPGENKPLISLEDDLKNAKGVVTWASGAALKALVMGIPVTYGFKDWIGATASVPYPQAPVPGDRLGMFRRLAWAMWNVDEIASGQAFDVLL